MERLLNKELEEKIRTLPKDPGVYLMKDQGGNVIYVGKARNLSNRVRQYFGALSGKQAKVAAMVQQRFKPDPFTNTLFLLCGRRLDCIREFCRDRDGCILLYKL